MIVLAQHDRLLVYNLLDHIPRAVRSDRYIDPVAKFLFTSLIYQVNLDGWQYGLRNCQNILTPL